MSDCLFCKIAAGDLPSIIVYETQNLIVIKDINAQAPIHLLVIPKVHFETLLSCQDSLVLADMLTTAINMSETQGFAGQGFRTVINTNEDGGQVVRHLHMHILAGRPLSGIMG